MKRAYAYLAAFFLIGWLVLTALFTVSLNDEIYDWMQRRSGVTEKTCGLTDVERMALNRSTAMYLAGRTDAIEGVTARAQAHMKDVRALFSAARWGMYACFALFAITGVFAWKYQRARVLRAYLVCAGAFVALFTAIGAVCAVDFDSAFQAFHYLFFTNDLWLLDPAQDALIRILPGGFFARMAVLAAAFALFEMLIAGAAIAVARKLTGRRETE